MMVGLEAQLPLLRRVLVERQRQALLPAACAVDPTVCWHLTVPPTGEVLDTAYEVAAAEVPLDQALRLKLAAELVLQAQLGGMTVGN